MEKIKINTIIEIVGMPKEHVVDTMQKVIDLIEKDEEIKLESKDTAEPELIKDLWSTFTEFELEFETFKKLTGFCFDFMPSSVEIISPEKPELNSKDIEDLLNDVLAKTHQYDMALKRMILEKRAKDRQENSKTA
ncbi:hypothetical protein HOA59_01885 [archaeon]|mgnify:CR=1 FL=1|jgi:hypothetical protein|nr:hypothetical protein [archaeon]MBT6824167.1 hypothetical protein [archaeon]MBT7106989.1 hypothetical protein [archaeon]MBT7297601.1 hypothetical protein [archaeon]